MSTKKQPSKGSRKKRPSKALLKEISEVFEKHNWPTDAIVIHALDSSSAMDGGLASSPAMLNCQPPAKPELISRHRSDGTIETGWACL